MLKQLCLGNLQYNLSLASGGILACYCVIWLHEGELLLEHVWNIPLRVQKVLKNLLPSGMWNVEDSHVGVHKLNSWIIFYHRKGSVITYCNTLAPSFAVEIIVWAPEFCNASQMCFNCSFWS